MVNILLAILPFLITLTILVGIHELGHFIMARLFGINVLQFSIGFGKSIMGWRTIHGTEYRVGIFPIGGYVKMLDEREGEVAAKDLPFAYNRRPLLQRFSVVIMGPVMSLAFAFFAFWLMYAVGVTQLDSIVGDVLVSSPADIAGLHPQSEIVEIDDASTSNWLKVAVAVLSRLGDEGEMVIKAKDASDEDFTNHKIDLTQWRINPSKPQLLESLGIIPFEPKELSQYQHEEHYSILSSMVKSAQDVQLFTQFNLLMLSKLITGKISFSSLGGPLALFTGAYSTFKEGFTVFLNFLGILSVALAVINLLPIPGLDGGHLMYLGIEKVRKKPISLRWQVLLLRLSTIVLTVLLFNLLLNDLLRLVR